MFGLHFVMHYLESLLVLHSLDEEERANCFALIVLLMSCDCLCPVALPQSGLQYVIVVLPEHTHIFINEQFPNLQYVALHSSKHSIAHAV